MGKLYNVKNCAVRAARFIQGPHGLTRNYQESCHLRVRKLLTQIIGVGYYIKGLGMQIYTGELYRVMCFLSVLAFG